MKSVRRLTLVTLIAFTATLAGTTTGCTDLSGPGGSTCTTGLCSSTPCCSGYTCKSGLGDVLPKCYKN
jgi:hypothetical protein